jgi:hypothetical protein
MLSYHKCRECVAAGIFRFIHIKGSTNPADILSKHWDLPSVWDSLKPLLFFWRKEKEEATDKKGDG